MTEQKPESAEHTIAALVHWIERKHKKKPLPTIPIGTRVSVRNMGVGTVVARDGYGFDGVAVIFDPPAPEGFEDGCCAGVDECEVLSTRAAEAALADDARWGFIDPHGQKAAQIREVAAATWGLPPTCACPDDCDCDGVLVCLVCWERSKPHHAGREDHADREESLAAKRALGWDDEHRTRHGMERPMSTVNITETCACGAKFTASGDSWGVANRQGAFRKQHAGCRKPEPGMCGDPSETVIDGERRTTMFCQLRAGHDGFHEDGQGCSWGRLTVVGTENNEGGR